LGPVKEPLSVVPVRVLVTEPCPDIVFPRALVALPLAVAVDPLTVTLPVALPPFFPVTVWDANATGTKANHANKANKTVFFKSFSPSISARRPASCRDEFRLPDSFSKPQSHKRLRRFVTADRNRDKIDEAMGLHFPIPALL